ncbi:MAG: hypothetical protein R3E62_04255 [Pseudomonadales bacterium]
MKLGKIIPALALSFCSMNSNAGFIETFDDASTVSDTHFSNTFLSGGGIFEPDSLVASQGAPTNPALPISSRGDKELRYYEGNSIAPTHSYATTPLSESYKNVVISGYVGVGITDTFGYRSSGLMARLSGSGFALDGYIAHILYGATTATFTLATLNAGVVRQENVLASTSQFNISPQDNNFFIELETFDNWIKASLWQTALGRDNFLISTLVAKDETHSSGGVGLFGFTRGGNSVFFDDIAVRELSLPSTGYLFIASLFYFFFRRSHKSTRKIT